VVAAKLFRWSTNVTLALPTGNFIEVRDGTVTGAIRLTAPVIPLVSGVFQLRDVELELNPADHVMGGSATVTGPGGVSLGADVVFRNGKLDAVRGSMRETPIPLGPNVVVRGGGFEVKNLTDRSKLSISLNDVTLSSRDRVSIDVLGQPYAGSLIEVVGSAVIDAEKLAVTGTTKALGGFMNDTTTIQYPWRTGEFGYGVSHALLWGFLRSSKKVVIGSNLDIKTGAVRGISLDSLPNFLPETVRNALEKFGSKIGFALNFTNDGDKANDYFVIWAPNPLTGGLTNIGCKWNFEGAWKVLLKRSLQPYIDWVNRNFA
jgi:hypothetical protein